MGSSCNVVGFVFVAFSFFFRAWQKEGFVLFLSSRVMRPKCWKTRKSLKQEPQLSRKEFGSTGASKTAWLVHPGFNLMLIHNGCHCSNTESIRQSIFRTRGLTSHWYRRNMHSHKGVRIIWRDGLSCSPELPSTAQPTPFSLRYLEEKIFVSLLAKGTRKEALISTVSEADQV